MSFERASVIHKINTAVIGLFAKDRNRLKVMNLILVAVYMLSVGLMLFLETRQRQKEILRTIDNRLTTAASVVKYLMADDFHDRAVEPDAVGLSEERLNRQRVNSFCRDNGFEWVYTIVEWGGHYYFTAPTVTELEAMNRESWYFYPYEDIPAEFASALESGETAAFSYRDEWGVHRSVGLPERSPKGNPYLSCVDYNMSVVDIEIYQGIFASALRFNGGGTGGDTLSFPQYYLQHQDGQAEFRA